MKKALIGAMLFALAAVPVLADGHISTHAEIWNRYENVSNFQDFTDTTGANPNLTDDDFDFGTYRIRAGMSIEFDENIDGMIEFQNFGNWGATLFPSNSQDPLVGGLDLTGASNSDVELYQAFVHLANIADSNFSLKFGRQEHTLGNELHIGDADFYGGQYFDGLRGMFDFETWELNLFYYLVQERNLLPGIVTSLDPGGSDDRTFWGAHAAFDINDSNSIEPYVLVLKDGAEGLMKMQTTTIGALYEYDNDDSQFDGSFEYAFQTGEQGNAGQTDISSWVAEGAFGYDFAGDSDNTNRIGIGLTIWADGDDANDNEAFQELFTDSHRRLGLADIFTSGLNASAAGFDSLHNLQDINVNWHWDNGTHGFYAAYHQFTAFEDFGGEDDIGNEIDLRYNFTHGEHFGVEVVAAMFEPGDAFVNDDGAMRIYAMGRVRK